MRKRSRFKVFRGKLIPCICLLVKRFKLDHYHPNLFIPFLHCELLRGLTMRCLLISSSLCSLIRGLTVPHHILTIFHLFEGLLYTSSHHHHFALRVLGQYLGTLITIHTNFQCVKWARYQGLELNCLLLSHITDVSLTLVNTCP